MKQFFIFMFLGIMFLFPTMTTDLNHTEYKRLRQYYFWITPKRVQIILYNCKKYNLEVDKVCGLINEESHGHSHAVSIASARGLMQIMPFNYRGPTIHLFNDSVNVAQGTRILKDYMGRARRIYGKNYLPETFRFYNAGPSRPHARRKTYKNWGYVRRILRNIRITRKIRNEIHVM